MLDDAKIISRRDALTTFGAVSMASALEASTASSAVAQAPPGPDLIPADARRLRALAERLAKAPRRRDFKTVPMILTDPDQWDHEALTAVMTYEPAYKQVANHTDIAGPLLNSMRNTINGEVWSFKHPDFLGVFATHGAAQLALYDQVTWDKYQLTRLAGDRFKTNTLIQDTKAASANPAEFQDPAGVYSPANNSIPALMRRGAVFLACHNAAWEQAGTLIAAGVNPDKITQGELTAELTNHLVPGVIITPGAVAVLSEFVRSGFQYVS